jgi:TRAP-type C4-dicarboxylate transport system permease small subunit
MPRALQALLRWSAGLGAVTLLLMGVLVTIDVAVRWLTGRPITGVFEVASLMLVVAIFLPLGFMQYQKLHIRVDIISSHARGRWAASLDILDAVAGLIVFGLLIWAAAGEFLKAYRGNFRMRGIIEIPTAFELGVIVFGTALILIALLHSLVKSARGVASGEPASPPVEPRAPQ